MSHISSIEVAIRSLETLQRACQALGLEFHQGQRQFRYFGGSAPCDHAIRVPDAAYELGVVQSQDGYGLQWDDWHSGGLEQRLGKGAGLLKQAYAVERVRTEAKRKGMRVTVKQRDQAVQLVLTSN